MLMVSPVCAEVSVKFSVDAFSLNTTNMQGLITLSFRVDADGKVVLDASADNSEQILQDTVNAWDGPVGTISYTGAFNTVFILELKDWGGAFTMNDFEGGGLGVSGQNEWRIDRPGFEFIAAVASIKEGTLDFQSVSWNFRSDAGAQMTLICPSVSLTNRLETRDGRWDVSGKGIRIGDHQFLRFGNVYPGDDTGGYSLAGFSFDVVGDDALIDIKH
jgi:hypothetical protein